MSTRRPVPGSCPWALSVEQERAILDARLFEDPENRLSFADLGRLLDICAKETRCPHFGLIPDMVASTLLVLTTGRQYCERYLDRLPVKILPCPIPFPRMMYYQLWHERTHTSASSKWLRDKVKSVAALLRKE